MDLNLLPPELLPPILNNVTLPLSERIRLRIISKTWRDAIEYGLKKETVLSIYENFEYDPSDDDDAGQAPKNLLQLYHITGPFIDLLGRLFPAVVELTVITWCQKEAPSPEPHLPELLAAFQSTLTSLNLQEGVPMRHFRIDRLARKRISSSINALQYQYQCTINTKSE